jgi:tetrahydromethanopterin S-methyltransferase subunit G
MSNTPRLYAIEKAIADLKDCMKDQFRAVDSRIDKIDNKIEKVETKTEARFDVLSESIKHGNTLKIVILSSLGAVLAAVIASYLK